MAYSFDLNIQNKLGKPKESECFNFGNKKSENCQPEESDTADYLYLLSPDCHDSCCLFWIRYHFYASLPNTKTLMIGGFLEGGKQPEKRLTQSD